MDKWRESVTVAVNRLQQETVKEELWQELQQLVQKAADAFQEHWPVPEKPTRYLRLECTCYPKVPPERAFSLSTGLEPTAREPYTFRDRKWCQPVTLPSRSFLRRENGLHLCGHSRNDNRGRQEGRPLVNNTD